MKRPTKEVKVNIAGISLGVVLFCLTALVGCMSLSTTTVHGSITTHNTYGIGSDMAMGAYPCVSSGGYSDINQGAQVTVYDDDDHVIGLGELGKGVAAPEVLGCRFSFTIEGVSTDTAFVSVEVSHRGRYRVATAELDEPVELGLG